MSRWKIAAIGLALLALIALAAIAPRNTMVFVSPLTVISPLTTLTPAVYLPLVHCGGCPTELPTLIGVTETPGPTDLPTLPGDGTVTR